MFRFLKFYVLSWPIWSFVSAHEVIFPSNTNCDIVWSFADCMSALLQLHKACLLLRFCRLNQFVVQSLSSRVVRKLIIVQNSNHLSPWISNVRVSVITTLCEITVECVLRFETFRGWRAAIQLSIRLETEQLWLFYLFEVSNSDKMKI